MRRVAYIVIGIVLAFFVSGGVWWYVAQQQEPVYLPGCVDIHIFVHGTVGTEFNVLSPFHCLSDTASEDTLSTRLSRRYRSHPYLRHDQLLGPEGIIEIPYHKIRQYEANDGQGLDTQNAWYHVLAAYDAVARKVGVSALYNHYFLFGWTGLLSNRARRRAGYALYREISDIRDRVRRVYRCEPRIRLITHSHGSNVALWAAQAASEEGTPFCVDLLFMMGAPIQHETISHIQLPFYKSIISSFSYGDTIQSSDYFSTISRQSCQRMADLIDLNQAAQQARGVRADMQYTANLQDNVVTHANMWMMARSEPVFTFMEPLPLVILAPALFAGISEHASCTYYQARLHGTEGYCVGHLLAREGAFQSFVYRSPNLYHLIIDARERVRKTWNPADDSRHLVFNYQNFSAIRHALGV